MRKFKVFARMATLVWVAIGTATASPSVELKGKHLEIRNGLGVRTWLEITVREDKGDTPRTQPYWSTSTTGPETKVEWDLRFKSREGDINTYAPVEVVEKKVIVPITWESTNGNFYSWANLKIEQVPGLKNMGPNAIEREAVVTIEGNPIMRIGGDFKSAKWEETTVDGKPFLKVLMWATANGAQDGGGPMECTTRPQMTLEIEVLE